MQTKSNITLLRIPAKISLVRVENSFTISKTTPMKKRLLQTAFFCLQFVLFTSLALNTTAQTVVTFPASSTWTCPAGVTSVKVECWGGGGAGGGGTVAATYSGGGGGGAYNVNNTVAVTPGTVYNITVGTGGVGTLVSGSAGGNSIFGASLVIANGGAGGTTVAGGVGLGGAGGTGGTFNGGNGAGGTLGAAPNPSSGGGGGGAGSTGAGGNAAGLTAGAAGATDGGIGGAGRGSVAGSGNGNPGATLGGGGSGGRASTASSRLGGNGANGQIRITFATPACIAPVVQPTGLVLTPSAASIAGSFTAAAGTNGYLVVMTTTATAPSSPINGTTYTAGTAALGGTIISAGATTSFTASSLAAGTTYWFWVYGYNNLSCSGGIAYLVTTPLTANATTTLPACTTPTGRPGSFSFTPITTNSITATFTASGSSNSYLTIMTATNTAPSNPVNGTTYTVGTSALGGTVVNASSSLSFTVSGLTPSTTYYFWNFSYNAVTCSGGPLYYTGSVRNGSTTTNSNNCVAPTAQPTSLILSPANTTIAGSFTASASANSYLVVMTTTATAPINPADGTYYVAGATALGGTIISVSGATSYTANGLTPGTQYWFWIFANNGVTCSVGPKYFTTSPLTGNSTTTYLPCTTPIQQPTALNLTPAPLSIAGSFTASASATRYLVIRTATATAPSNPVDGTTYTAGTSALGGYIESAGIFTTINSIGLTTATQYWYWVFAYNAVTCTGGGPLYLTAAPLTGTATTIACGALNTALLTNTSATTLNWSSLPWSLGHIPTSCETSEIILKRASGSASEQTIVITLDQNISVVNFLLTNASTVATPTILETTGSVTVNIAGDMIITAPGANKYNRTVYANLVSTTVNGNLILGRAVPLPTEGHSACGSGKNSTPNQTYNLYGDMTFNPRGYTTDEWAVFNFNKAGTQYLVNNTTVTDTVYPVLFEKLNIGTTNATTLVFSGIAKDTYIEAERAGGVTVGVNSTLDLPANYNMNKLTVYSNFSEPLNLLAGAKLRLGGDKSINVAGATIGIAGSNFPSNFNTLNFNATSTVEYYGDNTITQTIYNVPPYPNLLITNGAGVGRAQKKTTAPITVNTSFNINALADVTLGTLGSSTVGVISTGPLNINTNGGLYCNANIVSGVGAFTMGVGSYLGMGHALAITPLGTGIGNIQMTGARNYSTAGNYIYNGIVSQITNTGLPATVNDLTIDNPTTVTIAANQIVNGAHLLKQGTFDIGTTQITINGLGTMNAVTGKMKANLGTVEMKGTSGTAQNLSGNWFVNKTILSLLDANTTGISIAVAPSDTLLISKDLKYGVGTINSQINTNNNLTLLSNATNTANFGEIVLGSGNTIVGKVNIERYLFAKKAWRFLATPVAIGTSPTVTSAWRESNSPLTSNGYGTQVTGPAGVPTFDQYTQRASIKSYDVVTNNFIDVTNPSAFLANNAGYMVFVRGDRAVAVGGTTGATNLRIKGDVRMGNQLFSVPANMFQSFGNPYPARIDFRTVTKNNIVDGFTVWNPNSAGVFNVGAYETYVFDGTNYKRGAVIRNYIESGEAVFVQSNSASAGAVTVHEADKGSGSAMVSRVGVTRPTLEINLFAKDVDGSIYLADGVMLNFDNAYSANVDNNDVRKIMNSADNLAVKNGNYNLVVERRPNLTTTDTIKLSLTGVRVAPYRFEIDPSVLGNTGLEAFLKDKFLQTETPVSFTDVTTVPFDITATAASYAADRFMIVFKQGTTTNFTTISAIRNADKTVTVNWGTEGERNVTNYTVEQSNDGVNFTALATQAATANNGTNQTYSKLDAAASKANNWYRVKATNNNTTVKYTAIAMVGAINEIAINVEPKMSIYPNPVMGGNVNLHLDNQAKGNYAVQITNAAGQTVKAENVQVENNNTLRTIKIGTAATGTYQATVIDEAGKKTTMSFLVK